MNVRSFGYRASSVLGLLPKPLTRRDSRRAFSFDARDDFMERMLVTTKLHGMGDAIRDWLFRKDM